MEKTVNHLFNLFRIDSYDQLKNGNLLTDKKDTPECNDE